MDSDNFSVPKKLLPVFLKPRGGLCCFLKIVNFLEIKYCCCSMLLSNRLDMLISNKAFDSTVNRCENRIKKNFPIWWLQSTYLCVVAHPRRTIALSAWFFSLSISDFLHLHVRSRFRRLRLSDRLLHGDHGPVREARGAPPQRLPAVDSDGADEEA